LLEKLLLSSEIHFQPKAETHLNVGAAKGFFK
jgi:hypothetical protein